MTRNTVTLLQSSYKSTDIINNTGRVYDGEVRFEGKVVEGHYHYYTAYNGMLTDCIIDSRRTYATMQLTTKLRGVLTPIQSTPVIRDSLVVIVTWHFNVNSLNSETEPV